MFKKLNILPKYNRIYNYRQYFKMFGDLSKKQSGKIRFNFIYENNNKVLQVEAEENQNLLQIAKKYNLELEGVCQGTRACGTCHIYLENGIYKKIDPMSEDEEDLLTLAYNLKSTSRLGCQVKVGRDFEGTKVCIPIATQKMYVNKDKMKLH
jgi:ferredoxin